MNTSRKKALSLEEQAAIAVRLGRELNAMATAICAGGNSRDFGFVRRTLRRLGDREPFDPRDDASLDALAGIFDADLKSEILGHDLLFVETHFDADGQHGEVRDVPNCSDRGRKLQQVIETLTRFMAARNATIDRIAAERAVLRLLRM